MLRSLLLSLVFLFHFQLCSHKTLAIFDDVIPNLGSHIIMVLFQSQINGLGTITWKAPYFILAEQEIPEKTAGKVEEERNHLQGG